MVFEVRSGNQSFALKRLKPNYNDLDNNRSLLQDFIREAVVMRSLLFSFFLSSLLFFLLLGHPNSLSLSLSLSEKQTKKTFFWFFLSFQFYFLQNHQTSQLGILLWRRSTHRTLHWQIPRRRGRRVVLVASFHCSWTGHKPVINFVSIETPCDFRQNSSFSLLSPSLPLSLSPSLSLSKNKSKVRIFLQKVFHVCWQCCAMLPKACTFFMRFISCTEVQPPYSPKMKIHWLQPSHLISS